MDAVTSADPATTDPVKTVFIDVDGTILEHGSIIAPSTVSAIRAARAAGHAVYLCTGRALGDIHPAVLEIGFDGAITNGGAFGAIGDELVLSHPMPRTQVDRLVEYFETHGIHYFLQTYDSVYASAGMDDLISAFVRQRRETYADDLAGLGVDADEEMVEPVRTFGPVTEAVLDDVVKAVFISTASDSLDRAQADLGDTFHVIPGSIPMPGGSNGEIGMLGVNKGAAITELLAHLGRDAADAVGIGDSWNDVEMFQVCGTSVAMGNADPQLQAMADHVTTSVLDDGVRNAFVTLGLI